MGELAVFDRRSLIAKAEQFGMLSGENGLQFAEQVWFAITQNPTLLRCDQTSVLRAAGWIARLRLMPGREAYLVPFKSTAQLIIGYNGYINLAHRAGLRAISAKPVYAADRFDFQLGTSAFLAHRPSTNAGRRTDDEITHAYCTWDDGGVRSFTVIDRDEIDRRRSLSRSSDRPDSPWQVHFPAMCAKSACRAAAPQWPQEADASRSIRFALTVDDRDDGLRLPPPSEDFDVYVEGEGEADEATPA